MVPSTNILDKLLKEKRDSGSGSQTVVHLRKTDELV
jgi:hypothetical protein